MQNLLKSKSRSLFLNCKSSVVKQALVSLDSCKTMREFKQLQAHTITNGLQNHPLLSTHLVKFLATSDSGCLSYALMVFRQLNSPELRAYNTIIKALSLSSDPIQAISFYHEMVLKGVHPNNFTFPPLVASCAKVTAINEGEKCHTEVVKRGFDQVIFVANSLVHMYACFKLISYARQVFYEMVERDFVSWNSMINGHILLGDIMNARKLFDEMPERNQISWNVMIGGYARSGSPGHGLKLFREMQKKGIKGTITTMVSILNACAKSARLLEGRSVHCYIIRSSSMDSGVILETALVDMYCKCGKLDSAKRVFYEMPERNLVSWNAMIFGQAICGDYKEALALFDSMELHSIEPDEVSYVGVLCACARGVALLEGRRYFDQMNRIHGIKPSFAHYWCMANLYRNADLVMEGEELIKSMPSTSPESSVWGNLLLFSRFTADLSLGEQIARRLVELEPYNGARYMLLWNLYAVSGKWEEVAKVREMMEERGLRRMPGCSLVDLNGIVHEFEAGDKSQPEMERVYAIMDEVARCFKLAQDSPESAEM
ncbi:hypothetical protein AMTRI_Chr07g24600 [Amborella trichopoda]|uniref:pentatricopeptide repeat-containing protein At3g51320 n=1 Tax=Amborella trichopoda TaxID=13333 RepID=UPI0005D3D534|nr:pentatricopeptide repeat-containing protein At3g51320 [Amborella trichopoda]|eukprot:XP_011628179.1 pentatricopeptide repeat-containing protein At3g51320 [Amborella trichopoda]